MEYKISYNDTIEITDELLLINDSFERGQFVQTVMNTLLFIVAVFEIGDWIKMRGVSEHSLTPPYLYIIIAITMIILLIYQFKFTSKTHIKWKEMESFKHRNRLGSHMIDIRSNNKIRRIKMSEHEAKAIMEEIERRVANSNSVA